nr:helitron helicase-like domain-containing protein [Tanacetum cinerariifolium]
MFPAPLHASANEGIIRITSVFGPWWQHNDAASYSAHGGTSSNQQSRPRSRQSVVPASTHLTHGVPKVNVQSHSRHEFTVGSSSSNARPRVSGPPAEYKDIGGCTYSCQHCGALFWYEERLRNNARGAHPRYNRCCKGGWVALRTYQIYPEYVKLLLQDRHFLENIRAYIQMFSMTSLGSLCPAEGAPPRFLQLYIYDTDNEVDNRMSHFGGDNSELRRDIVEGLIDLLDAHNALVQLFRTACAIVYETGPESDMDYDIVLEERSGYPQRVNKLHPSYMALQFPLLFIYGEDGYSKELKMVGVTGSSSEQKRNRIDYIREHQNDIKNEYLSGIYDAINGGITMVLTVGVDSYYRGLLQAGRATFLYTVEFQKRGLPHCHTLLWIVESDRTVEQKT